MRTVIFMKQETKQQLAQSIRDFHLPRYHEIPNVGLYLDQATKYVGEHLAPLGEYTLTPSMIRNYVSKGLIENPVKKQYGREQIAYLFFIAVAKSVLSLDALVAFIRLQQQTYDLATAYDYFVEEMENLIAEQGNAELTCQFCDNVQTFTREQLEGLLEGMRKK